MGKSFFEREFRSILLGKKLGYGLSRKVYICRYNKSLVYKIEEKGGYFQNTAEWDMWTAIRDNKDLNKWFAPCRDISASGAILIQERVAPITKEMMPKKMPSFFTDLKIENFGLLNGRVVACDYGNFSHWHFAHMKPRMANVEKHIWSSEDDA